MERKRRRKFKMKKKPKLKRKAKLIFLREDGYFYDKDGNKLNDLNEDEWKEKK